MKTLIIGTLIIIISGECPPLTPPPNGLIVGINEGVCGTKVGTTCQMSCRKRCKRLGDGYHTCLTNNTWSGAQSQCVDRTVRCRPRLQSPLNGFQVNPCRNWGGYVCTFACNNGYSLHGSSRIVCQRGHYWSASVPTCIPITNTQVYCPTLPLPANGAQRGNCESNSLIPGSTCIYSCNSGYRLIGESVLVCKSDGLWSSSTPTCHRLSSVRYCPALAPPTNGFNYGNCSPGVPQLKCNFHCNRGYHIVGSLTLICQSNGFWSSSTPICISN